MLLRRLAMPPFSIGVITICWKWWLVSPSLVRLACPLYLLLEPSRQVDPSEPPMFSQAQSWNLFVTVHFDDSLLVEAEAGTAILGMEERFHRTGL